MLTQHKIRQVDLFNMWDKLCSLHIQWDAALRRTESLKLKCEKNAIKNIVITGMGGSAMSGDILHRLVAGCCPVPIEINRSYSVPAYVNEQTLFIAISYSGDTEETLEAFKTALKRKAQIISITTGGELAKLTPPKSDLLLLPPDSTPRTSFGHLFVSLWRIFDILKLCTNGFGNVKEAAGFIEEQINLFSNLTENDALELAGDIQDTLPIIYSNGTTLLAVNNRLRNQFHENAKILAYGNFLPEMNHNEIVGWERIIHLTGKVSCILLRDESDHYTTKQRMEVTRELIEPHAVIFKEVQSAGNSLLERVLYLMIYGDFLTYYLAILNETDPTPITKIDLLKTQLAVIKPPK